MGGTILLVHPNVLNELLFLKASNIKVLTYETIKIIIKHPLFQSGWEMKTQN